MTFHEIITDPLIVDMLHDPLFLSLIIVGAVSTTAFIVLIAIELR